MSSASSQIPGLIPPDALYTLLVERQGKDSKDHARAQGQIREAYHVGNAPIRILDASYAVPPRTPTPYDDFLLTRLPGAQFFHIDKIADPNTNLPHMVPSAEVFGDAVSTMGISKTDWVIVYDQTGVFSAPRVWWMLRLFGHKRASVLNGGLPAWQAKKYPVDTGPSTAPKPGNFRAILQPKLLWRKDNVLNNLKTEKATLVDARPEGRFQGTAPEPRPHLPSGHIPHSLSMPWYGWLDEDRAIMVESGELKRRWNTLQGEITSSDSASADNFPTGEAAPWVMTCGSGVSACVGALALYTMGYPDIPVYDGSWSEWASDPDTPKVTDSQNMTSQ